MSSVAVITHRVSDDVSDLCGWQNHTVSGSVPPYIIHGAIVVDLCGFQLYVNLALLVWYNAVWYRFYC